MSVISTPSVAMLLVHPVSGGQFACAVRGLVFRFHLSVCHMQLAVPNVVAMAVRMVITMLRILPQVVLLLKVPILFRLKVRGYRLKVKGER